MLSALEAGQRLTDKVQAAEEFARSMRIFLSYASEQESQADQIAIGLRERRHKVFFSKDNLAPARGYDETIRRNIYKSDLFVFLISPNSVEPGRYTLTEIKFARERWPAPGNHVLPVFVLKTPIEHIPEYLRHVTILKPDGNLKAEVLAHIGKLSRRHTVLRNIFLSSIFLCLSAVGVSLYTYFTLTSPAYRSSGTGSGTISTMVNISRIADFSKLNCASGKKNDIANLVDGYELLNPRENFYSATAIALSGDEVAAYDEKGGWLKPQDIDSEEGRQKVFKWNLPLDKNKAYINYKWTHAHQAASEGLAFNSSYMINEIDAKVVLPTGTRLEGVAFNPSIANAKCLKVKEYKNNDNPVYEFKCSSLMTGDEVRIRWNWDVWKDCKK